jgi:hypothetical protein
MAREQTPATFRLGARRLYTNMVGKLRSNTFDGEARTTVHYHSCLLGGVE